MIPKDDSKNTKRIKRTKCGVCNMSSTYENRFGFVDRTDISDCMECNTPPPVGIPMPTVNM